MLLAHTLQLRGIFAPRVLAALLATVRDTKTSSCVLLVTFRIFTRLATPMFVAETMFTALCLHITIVKSTYLAASMTRAQPATLVFLAAAIDATPLPTTMRAATRAITRYLLTIWYLTGDILH